MTANLRDTSPLSHVKLLRHGKENMNTFVEIFSYTNFLLEYFGEHK